jgi:hypothetical protein
MKIVSHNLLHKTTKEWHRQFVTDAELETLTGIKQRTWQKHRLFNRGPRWFKLHGAVRYDIAEVLAWIDAHAAGGEAITPHADASNPRERD